MSRDLLIEIGTEELPPKALQRLSNAFTKGVSAGLNEANLTFAEVQSFAAPRRLAILLRDVAETQPDSDVQKKGPAVKAAFDENGEPSKAAQGFARSCGVEVADLDRMDTPKGEWLVFNAHEKGKHLSELLPQIVTQSLNKLPIPKRMRWGASNVEFVRPVKWVVMLFGSDVIDATILGKTTGRTTYGHRFHAPDAIELAQAADYEAALQKAYVVACVDKRRDAVVEQANAAAAKLDGTPIIDADLLEEVACLIEWPVAVTGSFDKAFLEVPAEALISSMQDHQKYFPIAANDGSLSQHFITISNIQSSREASVSEGNERVINPRLSDAVFFWKQDRKVTLEARQESLNTVVFQNKLGTLGEKSRRVAAIAQAMAKQIGANEAHAQRAALLAKCDLMTEMVGEFPQLQGIMGRYYATLDGEDAAVALAIDEQYMPRNASDGLPSEAIGQIVSIADKLDSVLGIFSIGQKSTGDKDPFALRRASLGILRISIEKSLAFDLRTLFEYAAEQLTDKVDAKAAIDDALLFVLERSKAYYQDRDMGAGVFDAVFALQPTCPADFDQRMRAVNAFKNLAEADALAAANKRIGNILKKVEGDLPTQIQPDLFSEAAETQLYEAFIPLQKELAPLFEQADYSSALTKLACLRDSIDAFFDGVMVMADDAAVKANRIALLNAIRTEFMRVADVSYLS